MEPLAWYRIAAPVTLVILLTLIALLRTDIRLRSLVLGIWLMTAYAMLQDQVSSRLCPEYFTIFHNPIPGLTDPNLVGIAWGFLGSWWGGAILGYSAGLTATLGDKPCLQLRNIVKGMLVLLGVVGIMTALGGFSVYRHAELFQITLCCEPVQGVPEERRRNLFIVACYHLITYGTAIIGSVLLCLELARQRHRLTQ